MYIFFFVFFKSKYVFFNNSASTQTALNRLTSNNFVSSWFIWHRYKKINSNDKNYAYNTIWFIYYVLLQEKDFEFEDAQVVVQKRSVENTLKDDEDFLKDEGSGDEEGSGTVTVINPPATAPGECDGPQRQRADGRKIRGFVWELALHTFLTYKYHPSFIAMLCIYIYL